MEIRDQQIREKLKQVFGYNYFRGNQEPIIHNLMNGSNTFVIMPTGAGKSLCYQLPAIVQEGTAIVISPLIALMKNQVDQMNAVGINAQFLNSTLSKSEITQVRKDTISGKIKLLYVAPESLNKDENISFLKQAKISFVAVDEAHCISEWGHDFRPEYRKIKSIIAQLGQIPVIALTATATPKVQQDIQKNLQMDDSTVFLSSFNRENLFYEIRPKKEAKKQLVKFIKDHHGKSGIVYCLSRKKVEELAEFLKINGIKSAPYHAGLDNAVRMKNQDDFLNEEVDVIVATIAFGMGIDKPDVRFVVHYDAPKSLEGYYQETGRAGRDGIASKCVMFYSVNDINKLEKFSKDKTVTERENAKLLLEEVSAYVESSVCRRRHLLHYFGERLEVENCENCDNCTHQREKFEAQTYIQQTIETVKGTDERFDINHIVSVLTGKNTDHVVSYSHNKLPVFGVGKDHDEIFWKSVVRQANIFGFLDKDMEAIGVFKVTEKGNQYLTDPFPVTFTKNHDYTIEGEEEETEREVQKGNAYDEQLFELLKGLRKKLAKQKNLPPYVIFQDPSLEEMATVYPTSEQELAQINGVGMGKVIKFGKPFIELITKYVEENEIETASEVVVKSQVNKSKTKIFIIQQIDKKVDLEEIAESIDLSFEDMISEIENICYSGTKLNLDYYVNQIMDKGKQREIAEYFLSSESDDIDLAYQELEDEDITIDDIRIMRIKFLSEYAN